MSEMNDPILYKTSPLRIISYAFIFSFLLFLLLPVSRMVQDTSDKEEIIRTLEHVSTPPPPPSRQDSQKEAEIINDVITIESVQSEIAIEPLDISLEPSLEGDLQIKVEMGNFNVKNSTEDLLADIKMFSPEELDTTPMSLNDPLIQVPDELVAKGVKEINAEALVILTEKGNVKFERFISLSHPEGSQTIRQYIQKLRFTAPTKDGEVGRVRFRLPVRVRDFNE